MPDAPKPIRLRYKIDLQYDVRSDHCDFVFNVQATPTEHQKVVSERLGHASIGITLAVM